MASRYDERAAPTPWPAFGIPDEVLAVIIANCTPHDAIGVVPAVCWGWRTVAHTYTNLDFRFANYAKDGKCLIISGDDWRRLVESHPDATAVRVHWAPTLVHDDRMRVAEMRNLARLDFTGMGICNAFVTQLMRCKHLVDITFDSTAANLAPGIANLCLLQKLTAVSLNHCSWVGDAVLEELANCPNLARLAVRHTAVTDTGLGFLAGLPITHLDVAGNDISTGSLHQFTALTHVRATPITPTQAFGSSPSTENPITFQFGAHTQYHAVDLIGEVPFRVATREGQRWRILGINTLIEKNPNLRKLALSETPTLWLNIIPELDQSALTHLIAKGLDDRLLRLITACCRRLTHLSIADCNMITRADSVARLPLTSFDASNTQIDIKTLDALAEVPTLTRLIFLLCPRIDTAAVVSILSKSELRHVAASTSEPPTTALRAACNDASGRGVVFVIDTPAGKVQSTPSMYSTSQNTFYDEPDFFGRNFRG